MSKHPLQTLIDNLSTTLSEARAQTQMTLGQLIDQLETLDGDRKIDGFGDPASYRGYYSDLSFESGEAQTVSSLLNVCQTKIMGRSFTGYKGGEFIMSQNTPVWFAAYGCTGPRLMSLDTTADTVVGVIAYEDEG